MRQLLPILFVFYGLLSFGQNSLLNSAVSWFSKSDRTTLDAYLTNCGYRFMREKDSLDLHFMEYSVVKTENGTQPAVTFLLSDTSLEFISIDTYGIQGQQAVVPVLKSGRFKSIGTDINGNFITTTYDNGLFLIQEDYEAIGNPLGKGEIAYFRYRIFRKYGKFDTMNGEKNQLSEHGEKTLGSYKNGLLDGQRTIYFPNGTIKRTENYREGRLNGIASDYDTSGKLIHSSTHSYHWKYGMEKWYSREGKLVKSVQWQRDLPVGAEKQTFNGKVVGNIPYVKGLKHGLAKVPVYFDQEIQANYPLDTLNDEPLGIETVAYENGIKSGKAVCIDFNSPDTLYVAHYKNGKPDSTYSRYGQGGILYTTFFSDGLENGTRIYRIPSGELKDTVYRIEHYANGKRDGSVVQYYRREQDQLLTDPDPGFHLPGSATSYPKYIPGKWIPYFYTETYKNGETNGPYSIQEDSLNYTKGTYLSGRLHGPYESSMLVDKKRVKIAGNYDKGLRTGEWTTESISDSIVLTQQFENNRKHGRFRKSVRGFISEQRIYEADTLREITFLEKNTDDKWYGMEFLKNRDSVRVFTSKYEHNTGIANFIYVLAAGNYPATNTLLITLVEELQKNPDISQYLEGGFSIKTADYALYGDYKNGKRHGVAAIHHYAGSVHEKRTYQNGVILHSTYTLFDNSAPYSGTFKTVESNEQISVKNGLRHGWCIEYDESGKEIRRTKYAKGVLKKVIENH
ncbi:hypothetical protein D3C87_95930 [compost metagenome]